MNNLVDLVEEFSSKPRRVLAFMASLNPLLLPPETTPNTITRLHDQFRDLTSGMSLGDNHLMQQQPALKVGIVVKYFCIGMRPNIFAAGHGSLSSLISLGHFSSASFISEEKANLEIQKLRQELREEHERVKRLQCQLSTNVSDSNNFLSIYFCRYICRLTLCLHSSNHWPTWLPDSPSSLSLQNKRFVSRENKIQLQFLVKTLSVSGQSQSSGTKKRFSGEFNFPFLFTTELSEQLEAVSNLIYFSGQRASRAAPNYWKLAETRSKNVSWR